MGKSKELFEMMREQEINTNNFLPTKKEIVISSNEFIKKIIDSGEIEITELYSQTIRAKEAINTIESQLKKHLGQENFEAYGIKGTYRNGGDTINYKDDDIIQKLENKLAERKELL